MKAICYPVVKGVEEEATLDPICTDGLMYVVGPWVVTTTTVGERGVLRGTSSGLIGSWLAFRGLFRPRRAGGGVGLYLGFVVARQDVYRVATGQRS